MGQVLYIVMHGGLNECSGTSVHHDPSHASSRRLLRTKGDNEKAVTDLPKFGSDLFVFSEEDKITPAMFF